MDIFGYEIEEEKNGIIVKGLNSFLLKDVLESGQSFRWKKNLDGTYILIAKEKVVKLEFCNKNLIIYNADLIDFKTIWFYYFDLETNYEIIKSKLKKDEVMNKAIAYGSGIRIMKQDFWEMLISFIISANNRIPMIMKVVNNLSEKFGDIVKFEGETFYTFPTAERLANAKIEDVEECRAGYRAQYIIDTSRSIVDNVIDIEKLKELSTNEAEKELIKLKGVGPKVAACILLFSGIKTDVFPIDVWIKRVVEFLYLKKESTQKEIKIFASEYFGDYSGIAQQYLFYYGRENKIGF